MAAPLEFLIGSQKSPGLLDQAATTGERAGNVVQAWAGLLGPLRAKSAPPAPAPPAPSNAATVPPASGPSLGQVAVGVAGFVLVVVLFLKGR